jgi:hypothetical protein
MAEHPEIQTTISRRRPAIDARPPAIDSFTNHKCKGRYAATPDVTLNQNCPELPTFPNARLWQVNQSATWIDALQKRRFIVRRGFDQNAANPIPNAAIATMKDALNIASRGSGQYQTGIRA